MQEVAGAAAVNLNQCRLRAGENRQTVTATTAD